MSILEDLYYGKLNPSQVFFEEGSDYGEKLDRLLDEYGIFEKGLDEKEIKKVKELGAIQNELSCMSQKESFERGFRLGARLVWEILEGKSKDFI